MTLNPGTRLGPHEIVGPLGVGGMGEVYRATDTNLKRQVAIKVLPASVAADAERLARFQREAEILAALNHPNIAHIHGLEKADGTVALVMEMVEGQTLADRIAQGPIPLDQALPIATQIAEALEAAHEQGIVHRDLKPANVKVREDGTVKVLDFGLAKAMDPMSASSASASVSPTLSLRATQAGIILGTAAYMSPEQAAGRKVDKRSDLWAFGVVFLEMLTGRQVFNGETVSHVLASVLKDEPDWATLPPDTPAPIRRLLRRCLQKDRKRRLADASDARLEIDEALMASADGTPVDGLRTRSRQAWMLGALILASAVAVIFGAIAYYNSRPVDEAAIRATLLPPDNWTVDFGAPPTRLAISPDGRRLAFVAAGPARRSQLWIRPIDAPSALALSGTDGAALPFWSPDSRLVGFFADGKLKKIAVSGGPAVILCDAGTTGGGTVTGGTWSPEGVIVFAKLNSGLSRVSASGGIVTSVTKLDGQEAGHIQPFFLPDGQHFLYRASDGTGVSASSIRIGSLDSRETRPLLQGVSQAMYSRGYLLFVRDLTLMAQAFDARRLELLSGPVPIAEQVVTGVGGNSAYSVSPSGVLVYQAGNFLSSRLTWVDRAGKQLGVLGEMGDWGDVQLSSDGTRAAVSALAAGSTNRVIWIFDLARGLRTRFTFDDADEHLALWSPDDNRILFNSNRKNASHHDLFGKASTNMGKEEVLLEDSAEKNPTSWSRDGRFVLYVAIPNLDLWVLPLFGDRKPFPFVNTRFAEDSGTFSPDGRWIAYRSNESGRNEVYVAPFPGPGARTQISTEGAVTGYPRWRRDGNELFYLAPDNRLMAVEVNGAGAVFEVKHVRPLFDSHARAGVSGSKYDVSADGQRFLINMNPESTAPAPITLVVNWTAGLKK